MVELSVVIPTYNRAESLRRCLLALGQQTQSAADFEVIVVVDGSSDGTCAMLERLSTPYQLVVIEQQPNQGAAVARNRGAERASGKYCLFLDDDIVAGPALIAEHLAGQRRSTTGGGVV